MISAPRPKSNKPPAKETIYTLLPWSCVHNRSTSRIEAYVAAKGDWATVAEIRDAAGIDAEQLSNFIIRVVNDYEKGRDLIEQMAYALELCLGCKLSWEAEHEAQVILKRIQEAK